MTSVRRSLSLPVDATHAPALPEPASRAADATTDATPDVTARASAEANPALKNDARRRFHGSAATAEAARSGTTSVPEAGALAAALRGGGSIDDRIEELIARFQNNRDKRPPPKPPAAAPSAGAGAGAGAGGGGGGGGGGATPAGGAGAAPPGSGGGAAATGSEGAPTGSAGGARGSSGDAPMASAQVTAALREGFTRDTKQLASARPEDAKALAQQAFPGKIEPAAFVDAAKRGALPQPAKVRFVDGETLQGNRAAYDKRDGGTVLLDKALLRDPQALQKAYNEEAAHHIDETLGGADAPGDEGQIFAEGLAQQAPLGDARLAALRADQDHGRIDVDGAARDVEFAGGADSGGRPSDPPAARGGAPLPRRGTGAPFGQEGAPAPVPPGFGGALPPGFPPLHPKTAQQAAAQLRNQGFPGAGPPASTRNGGLPEGSGTPTPAEVGRAYEHLGNEWQQAQMDVAQAFTPEQRVAAQRRLEDVRVGLEKLADHARMNPEMQPQLQAMAARTRAQAAQNEAQFLEDLKDTGAVLDPKKDDVDRIAAAARGGDEAAVEAWAKAKGTAQALGNDDALGRFAESELLAGENPAKAKELLDKLPFAKNPAERAQILEQLHDAGGVTHKRALDKAKVDDAVLKFAESPKTADDRAALRKALDALPDSNAMKGSALRDLNDEEQALKEDLKPGQGTPIHGLNGLTRDATERRGAERADVITRGLTNESGSEALQKAREQIKEPTSDAEREAKDKLATFEQLARMREGKGDATKALGEEAKKGNLYARAALRLALDRGDPTQGGNGPGAGPGTGPGSTPGTGPGTSAGGSGSTGAGGSASTGARGSGSTGASDSVEEQQKAIDLKSTDARVRLPEQLDEAQRQALVSAAADAFADGNMTRDEARALSSELARTKSTELSSRLQKALDAGIASKKEHAQDVLGGVGDTLALGQPGSEKLAPTFLRGKELPGFTREVGKLGGATISGARGATDVMGRLAASNDAKYAAFAERALTESAKAGHAEQVTRSLTDVPASARAADAGHYHRALGRAAGEWKDGGAHVDARHKAEVMSTLEGGLAQPAARPREQQQGGALGAHAGAAAGLAALPQHWTSSTTKAIGDNVSAETTALLGKAADKIPLARATELRAALGARMKSANAETPAGRADVLETARSLGQLGRFLDAKDVKAAGDKLGKMKDNADGLGAFIELGSRVDDPAAKQAVKDALFDKTNRWEQLDKLGGQEKDKVAKLITGSGDDDLSADAQKLVYGLNIRPPVAGLMKDWGVSGTPAQRKEKAQAARANYGEDAVRNLGARTSMWNAMSAPERAATLGLDAAKLTPQEKALVSRSVDPAWAAERAADGTLHRGDARFLLEPLERKVDARERAQAKELSTHQADMRSQVSARQKDIDALVKYTEKGVGTLDDIGHVLSYLNPANVVFGRASTEVDRFESNQNAGVRNLQRHDRALSDTARKIGDVAMKQVFTSSAKASFDREKAVASGDQREADLIALGQWKQHGDALRELSPGMYRDLHKRGDGDPRNEGAWQRLHRNGVVGREQSPEYTGTPEQRRAKALATLGKPLGSGAEADAVRKHALHTFDTDPSLQRMQESAGIIARGLPDVGKLLDGGMKGRKYQEFVDDLRARGEPLQKALGDMKKDAPQIRQRMQELKVQRDGADGETKKAIDDRMQSMQGMLDMVDKSDGTKALLDTVMDKSKLDADTWSNWLQNEGPKVAAGLAVGVGAAALCVATCGAAAPFVVVAGAAALGGAAGGLIGYEGARETMHALRNNFDSDITSGKLKWSDRSRAGSYAAGDQMFDPTTGQMKTPELWGDVLKPYGKQFLTDAALSAATMGIGKGLGAGISKVLTKTPSLAGRTGQSLAQMESVLGKEAARRTAKDIFTEAAKRFPKELADESLDTAKEAAVEKMLSQVDTRLGMAASVVVATGKSIKTKAGGAGFDYDASTFKDTVGALENNGFAVTHDPGQPGRFTVNTKEGPVVFSPTEGAISPNAQPVSQADVDAAQRAQPAPLPAQNDPVVLRERAQAQRELADSARKAGDAPRADALKALADKLDARAAVVGTNGTNAPLAADPALDAVTRPAAENVAARAQRDAARVAEQYGLTPAQAAQVQQSAGELRAAAHLLGTDPIAAGEAALDTARRAGADVQRTEEMRVGSQQLPKLRAEAEQLAKDNGISYEEAAKVVADDHFTGMLRANAGRTYHSPPPNHPAVVPEKLTFYSEPGKPRGPNLADPIERRLAESHGKALVEEATHAVGFKLGQQTGKGEAAMAGRYLPLSPNVKDFSDFVKSKEGRAALSARHTDVEIDEMSKKMHEADIQELMHGTATPFTGSEKSRYPIRAAYDTFVDVKGKQDARVAALRDNPTLRAKADYADLQRLARESESSDHAYQTKPPAPGAPRDVAWDALKDPSTWRPERAALQKEITDKTYAAAAKLSDNLTKANGGQPVLVVMRGNSGAGKTTALKGELGKQLGIDGDTSGVINPDDMKVDLQQRGNGGWLTGSQTLKEGAVMVDRVVDRMFAEDKSMVLDKRFAYPSEIAKLAETAKAKGYKVVVLDIDAELDTSAGRVAQRQPGTASPTVPYDAVEDGFKQIRANRGEVAALKNVDEYVLIKSDTVPAAADAKPKVVFERKGDKSTVHDDTLWQRTRTVGDTDAARARWKKLLDDNSRRRPDPTTALP